MNEIIINGHKICQGADLLGANLQRANLQRADLRGADLRGADLRGADLQRADLLGANLRGADLLGANLQRADLRGADLRGADLRGANLQRADLRGADLRGAKLLISFFPSIRFVSQINFYGLPDNLTLELMRRDCFAHPNPELFDDWAAGGDCPYNDAIERNWFFREIQGLWKPGNPTMRDSELIIALFEAKGWKIKL